MARTAQLTARVEPELKETVDFIARKEHISTAQLIINALTLYIKKWNGVNKS